MMRTRGYLSILGYCQNFLHCLQKVIQISPQYESLYGHGGQPCIGLVLEKRIEDKSSLISIVGLGYVGLPLAVAFVEAGFRVLGVEVQQSRVDLVNQGRNLISAMFPVSDYQQQWPMEG